MPLVSVVMPAYNSAKFVVEAIESVKNQTFKDFEFIVVDDCSTDDTLSVIKKTLMNFDNPYKIIENESNMGVSVSRNIANRIATGEFIAVVDSDDINLSTRLEEEVDFLKREKSFDVCGSLMEEMGEDGELFRSAIPRPIDMSSIKKWMYVYGESPILHPSSMYRKKAFFEMGGYDEDILWCHDFDLFFKMVRHRKKMHNLQSVLAKYRVVKESLTHRSSFRNRRVSEECFVIRRSGLLESEWDEEKNGKYKFEHKEAGI